MSPEFLNTGQYRTIDNEHVKCLMAEIIFSLDGASDENTKLEVGRLVAVEAIVCVSPGEHGTKVNIYCKLVDVETGLMLGAARDVSPDFENVLENLSTLIGVLCC